MKDILSLTGKNILVTGASSGFGRAISITSSQHGANVILTARNLQRLNETCSMLNAGEHNVVPYDLCDVDGLDGFVANLPILDGVVLCAGILKTVPVRFMKSDDVTSIFNTNTFAPFLLVQKLLQCKKLNKGGSVIFISSIATNHASPGNAIYGASKGALVPFCRVLALELSRMKIRCNCVHPGLVRTGISDLNVVTNDDLINIESSYPLGAGSVEDIANSVLFLLSDASKWITGTSLVIDGGATLN